MKVVCKLLYITLTTLMLSSTISAQDPAGYSDKLDRARLLYQKSMYPAAIKIANDIIADGINRGEKEFPNIEALILLCNIKLNQPNIDGLVDDYLSRYPYSTEKSNIILNYAAYYFNLQDYIRTNELLEDLTLKNLTPQLRNEYNFMKGYIHMRIGNLKESEDLLKKVISYKHTAYTNPAKYYLAYLAYMQQNFKDAIKQFEKIQGDSRFSLLASFYSMESRFMLKEYEKVIEQGENIYSSLSGEFKIKVARFLSEAYFATGNTQKANYYFEQFKFSTTHLSRKDTYYAGIIAYSLGNYTDAADAFTKLGNSEDTLSQNAQYHLGHSYIQIKNKQAALEAFRHASRFYYDSNIREDALFNYAKLSFDLNGDINIFKQYLQEYLPIDSKFNEIQNYIATSYILNKDYKSAIEALSQIRFPQPSDVINLQKVTLLRGVELIEKGAFREAVSTLELSIANGNYNERVKDLSRFWLAEALYRDNQFKKSIDLNQLLVNNSRFKQTAEYPLALFNIAYSHFSSGNYPQAELWFGRYIALKGSGQRLTEARLRLGDALFMQRKYRDAEIAFALVNRQDMQSFIYAQFQSAIAKGLGGDERSKINTLRTLATESSGSKLHPEIIFELGRTLVQSGDNGEAAKHFKNLIVNYKESEYYSKSMLELGLMALNRGDHNEAIDIYKQILTFTPNTQEAHDAIAGLESIYQERGEAEEFLSFLDKSNLSSTRTMSDRENIIFASAEKLYLNNNYSGAINSLTSFISKYPNSSKKGQALFYLGDSYNRTGKPEMALEFYKKVMDTGESSFAELATLYYARISYSLENYKESLNGYSSLILIARLENNKKEAILGRLKSFFMDKQYDNAVIESDRIDKREFNENELREIKFIKAKSLYLTGHRADATTILKELSANKLNILGAEAAYLIIANHFDNGNFDMVERETFALSDSGTPHMYWLAKSFILLGDSYLERDNPDQARATYESILQSYKTGEQDDILDQVKIRLEKLR